VRVVQVGKYYYPYVGGIESHLFTLCNELKGHVDLDVVVSNTTARTVREVQQGISITRCAALGRWASTSLSPTMALEIRQRPADVVHVHLPHPVGAASCLAALRRKQRLIVTYHSDVVRQQRLLALYAPLVDRLLARAEAVIATSPDYVESSTVLQRFREKCVVVPYGIDLGLFRRTDAVTREAARIRERYRGAPLLIAVGRLIYYKGFEIAIRALASVPNAHLIVIGDGPLRGNLKALALECGVSDRVHLIGELQNDEIPPFYFASDIYLLPSIARSEAFGIVQIEAMACELPVINTALPSGVPFVSRHGESGLTVPPSDVDALARAINELLADEPRRREMGAKGRTRAELDFSKETLARRLLELYAG